VVGWRVVLEWRVGVPTIGVDEACPPQVNLDGHKYMPLTSRRGAEAVHDIPGSGKATEDLWAYCLDGVHISGSTRQGPCHADY
jgi:hypothetical protein